MTAQFNADWGQEVHWSNVRQDKATFTRSREVVRYDATMWDKTDSQGTERMESKMQVRRSEKVRLYVSRKYKETRHERNPNQTTRSIRFGPLVSAGPSPSKPTRRSSRRGLGAILFAVHIFMIDPLVSTSRIGRRREIYTSGSSGSEAFEYIRRGGGD